MKKIVPFTNTLDFKTDVCEITAISLEHEIVKDVDCISGNFLISGEYKINDGDLLKEPFDFSLPFDIALGCNYNIDTLLVDIDDFRYELIDRNKLKVSIDLYVDGEIVKDEEINFSNREIVNIIDDDNIISSNMDIREEVEEKVEEDVEEVELLNEMLEDNKGEDMKEEIENEVNITNNIENNNIFNISNNNEEVYVTYRVYSVSEGDTVDKIMEKYKVTKEELEKYNNLEDIKIGDKLIIPSNEK